MGQNFDDYPGFQQIPGMPILLQHSVRYILFLKLMNPRPTNINVDRFLTFRVVLHCYNDFSTVLFLD